MSESTKEHARRMKLPSTMKGHRGRAWTELLVPRPKPLEQRPIEVSEESEGELVASILGNEYEV